MDKKLKVLFVAGNWDKDGGRPSKYMGKFINSVRNYVTDLNLVAFNGGHYDELETIIQMSKDVDTVFWFANVPNDLPKIRDIKEVNYKAILINSKRNDNNKYHFQELISMALSQKSNLTCEIRKNESGHYEMRIFDPLGTVWSNFTTNISKSVAELFSRLMVLKDITRQSVVYAGPAIPVPADTDPAMLEKFKQYGDVFHDLVQPKDGVKRYLGNMSFRCLKGFPSFKVGNLVYVSKRNTDKSSITYDDFVATTLEDNKVYYYGDNKPSVDTPIQLKLYKSLPDVNMMLHAHVYVENAPFTERAIPCGGLEEIPEVMRVVLRHGLTTNFCVNLIGHGSIVFARGLSYFDSVKHISREVPESIDTDFEPIVVDDGVATFIHTLKGRPLQEGELLEVMFTDGSIGTHQVKIKAYRQDELTYHTAYVEIVVKGTPIELYLAGLKAPW